MFRFKSKILCVFLALSAVFSLSLGLFSCQKDHGGNNETVKLTDALGREVNVAKEPKRVASLLGSFSDIWVLSGGELCASAEDAWEDFGLSLDGAVNIGGAHSPSLELLVSSEPDLVLASASTVAHVDMKDSLEAMGITVVYFDIDSFYDYLEVLDVCTDITGRKDLYEQNGLALKERIDAVKERFASACLSADEKKVLLLRTASTSVKAKGSEGTIFGEMLSDIGCVNIADSNAGLLEDLSVEAVIAEEPYRIFAVTMGSNTEKAKENLENTINEDPAWSELEAVRAERLHIMDKQLFNLKPNARWAEAYEVLYEILTEK